MRRDLTLLNGAMIPAAAVLGILLVLTFLRVGRENDRLAGAGVIAPLPSVPPAAEQTRRFFGWAQGLDWVPLTNDRNPFFTLAIQPAAPSPPPPPPPATRRIEVTYRGFMETSAGVRRALVQVDAAQVLGGLGENIVADYAAMEIALRHMILTNGGGQSVRLEFSKAQTIEVPAK